ncbi:MAG: anthranilate synthase component I family protein [Clostridiales bacterium]|nr:anthranilate synthase component I family protein [Clostridiales bacterium]MCF8023429.1 anthranilate synthase component I family protein [Clostridiales bacterium]
MVTPSQQEFVAMNQHYNLIPVFTTCTAINEDPTSIYSKLRHAFPGPSFLLENYNEQKKYTFIGCNPFLSLRSKNNKNDVRNEQGSIFQKQGPSTRILSSLLNDYKVPALPGLPHFFGGAAGYFAYDTAHCIGKLPLQKTDPLDMPDCLFMFPRIVIIIDHDQHLMKNVILAQPGNNPVKAYSSALSLLEHVKHIINQTIPFSPVNNLPLAVPELISTNISKNNYFLNVKKALQYIKKGDILQVVLSRRYSVPYTGDSLYIYERLRRSNPSPYMFYFDFGDPVILGASPEMLLRVEDNTVQTNPIAGTRSRNNNFIKDVQLEKDLLQDEKERAEHLMLVDLGRNDLGKVCIPGSIKVPQFMQVEKFSHVMHLVSKVEGILNRNTSPLQALEACFPAGTVSGAPKIRAMKIINEIEPGRRGVYAGAVGYAGFNRVLDTAIAIRTMVISKQKAYIQSGGGIVADSVPEKEYQETIKKAGSLMHALGLEESRDTVWS